MKFRWLSTFTVIGALLIVLGIVGLLLGPRFVFDPGQPYNKWTPLYYLLVGALMVLNGILTPPLAAESQHRSSGEKASLGTTRDDEAPGDALVSAPEKNTAP